MVLGLQYSCSIVQLFPEPGTPYNNILVPPSILLLPSSLLLGNTFSIFTIVFVSNLKNRLFNWANPPSPTIPLSGIIPNAKYSNFSFLFKIIKYELEWSNFLNFIKSFPSQLIKETCIWSAWLALLLLIIDVWVLFWLAIKDISEFWIPFSASKYLTLVSVNITGTCVIKYFFKAASDSELLKYPSDLKYGKISIWLPVIAICVWLVVLPSSNVLDASSFFTIIPSYPLSFIFVPVLLSTSLIILIASLKTIFIYSPSKYSFTILAIALPNKGGTELPICIYVFV